MNVVTSVTYVGYGYSNDSGTTCVTMGMAAAKKISATKLAVTIRMTPFLPRNGNSSTRPVITVSTTTICRGDSNTRHHKQRHTVVTLQSFSH